MSHIGKKKWTKEKVEQLEGFVGYISYEEIAKKLGMTKKAVESKIKRLGLNFDKICLKRGFYTQAYFAKYLGVPKYAVSRWFVSENFPANYFYNRDTQRPTVSVKDFWNWVIKDQVVINYSVIKEEVLEGAPDKIKIKARKNKLKPNHNSHWTREEIDFLEEKWGTMSVRYISVELGRTESAVLRKVSKLELPPAKENSKYITCAQLMKVMNYDYKVFLRWEKLYNFPVVRKTVVSKQKNLFTEIELFWKWAEKNKSSVDLTRFDLIELPPVPEWAYKERKKQLEKKKKQNNLNKEWTESDRLKLIYLRFKMNMSFPQIASELGRTKGSVFAMYRKISRTEDYESFKEKALKKTFVCHNNNGTGKAHLTMKWTAEDVNRLAFLLNVKQINIAMISEVMKRPAQSVKEQIVRLERNPKYKKILKKASKSKYPEYDYLIGQILERKTIRAWSEEEENKLLYMKFKLGFKLQEISEVLNRTKPSVDNRSLKLSKSNDFQNRVEQATKMTFDDLSVKKIYKKREEILKKWTDGKMNDALPWTEEADMKLLNLIHKYGIAIEEISGLLKRTIGAIKRRLSILRKRSDYDELIKKAIKIDFKIVSKEQEVFSLKARALMDNGVSEKNKDKRNWNEKDELVLIYLKCKCKMNFLMIAALMQRKSQSIAYRYAKIIKESNYKEKREMVMDMQIEEIELLVS